MSAEVLRRAASLMRERANHADDCHPSPWTTQREGQWEWSVRDAEGGDLGWTMPEHIASWHPSVALAVARLLECEADRYGYFHLAKANCREADDGGDCGCAYRDCYDHGKWHDCTHGEPDLTEALAVARAYLGESA